MTALLHFLNNEIWINIWWSSSRRWKATINRNYTCESAMNNVRRFPSRFLWGAIFLKIKVVWLIADSYFQQSLRQWHVECRARCDYQGLVSTDDDLMRKIPSCSTPERDSRYTKKKNQSITISSCELIRNTLSLSSESPRCTYLQYWYYVLEKFTSDVNLLFGGSWRWNILGSSREFCRSEGRELLKLSIGRNQWLREIMDSYTCVRNILI